VLAISAQSPGRNRDLLPRADDGDLEEYGTIEERLRDAMWRGDEGQWARIPGKYQMSILGRQWAQM
jgi:hypothetical protein